MYALSLLLAQNYFYVSGILECYLTFSIVSHPPACMASALSSHSSRGRPCSCFALSARRLWQLAFKYGACALLQVACPASPINLLGPFMRYRRLTSCMLCMQPAGGFVMLLAMRPGQAARQTLATISSAVCPHRHSICLQLQGQMQRQCGMQSAKEPSAVAPASLLCCEEQPGTGTFPAAGGATSAFVAAVGIALALLPCHFKCLRALACVCLWV